MVSSLSLLLNCNMIFRLKNGFSRHLFLVPQSYIWRGNLHVESPVLQSEMCWFTLTLDLFVLSPFVFLMFLFRYTFYISNNRWHWLSGSQFLWEFPKLYHLALWIYWFHLNNFEIFCIFCNCVYTFLVF